MSRVFMDRTLALLAGGLAALLLPAALLAGSAARLVLAPPAWGREFLSVGSAQRALVAAAAAAPAAACALWVRPGPGRCCDAISLARMGLRVALRQSRPDATPCME